MWASYKGHEDIVRELLDYGADPNERGQVSSYECCFAKINCQWMWEIFLDSPSLQPLVIHINDFLLISEYYSTKSSHSKLFCWVSSHLCVFWAALAILLNINSPCRTIFLWHAFVSHDFYMRVVSCTIKIQVYQIIILLCCTHLVTVVSDNCKTCKKAEDIWKNTWQM